MRIDELARRAGVPTRTIRYYTQQGLLNPPMLKGRVGFYDDAHVDRLRLIKELQEKRFLPLAVIKSVMRHYESGTNLETMLTPLDILFQPRWDTSDRVELTRQDLAVAAGVDAKTVDAAEEMGFLFPVGRGQQRRYTQDDVRMLAVTKRWLELAIPTTLGRLYRESLEEISEMQVRAFNDSVVAPVARQDLSPDEAKEHLLEGYQAMADVFSELVALLHRKLLQKVVETHAEDEQVD
jgi:DNA-binding transcriptional MerR regulator